jgi:hypothetical protein
MALFSKNANRAALFKKQTLYDKCCTPEVEECCYFANLLPRPICNCEPLFTLELGRNSYTLPLITPLVITSTPQTIYFIFENIDSCPIELDKLGCQIASPIAVPGFTITIVSHPVVVPGNSSLTIYSIEIDNTVLDGSYEFGYSYESDCGPRVSGSIQVDISLL